MLMVILAQATMNKTQMAAVTSTQMNSLLPENAACVEEEALDIMKIGTTTMTMIMIGIMIWMSVKVTSQSLMSMEILASHTMIPTQMVAVTTTLMNSLLLENAALVEVEALETIALEISHGTCILPMMKLTDMP